MKILIATAADERYAGLLRGLVGSLEQAGALRLGELGVLDLGMSAATLEELRTVAKRIVPVGWDLEIDRDVAAKKPWLRAMTARPFLPRHFPGYDMIVWIDADAWVQQLFPIEWLIQSASPGTMAAVPEADRFYEHQPEYVDWRAGRLKKCYPEFTLEWLLAGTYVNSGVLAIRADAPHWAAWERSMRKGLEGSAGKVVTDQTALNHALYTGKLPLAPLPATCNWLCHLATPEYRFADGLFVEPGIPRETLGILHLAGDSKDDAIEARGPDGTMRKISLRFDPAQKPR